MRKSAYVCYTVTEELGYFEKYRVGAPIQFRNKNKNKKYHERIKRAAFIRRCRERRQRRKTKEVRRRWESIIRMML